MAQHVDELPDRVTRALAMPKIFGSWPTVTKMASPKMNPSITGRDRNWVMKPSRNNPEARNKTPVKMIKPAASPV
jgi:hypothetical protein